MLCFTVIYSLGSSLKNKDNSNCTLLKLIKFCLNLVKRIYPKLFNVAPAGPQV